MKLYGSVIAGSLLVLAGAGSLYVVKSRQVLIPGTATARVEAARAGFLASHLPIATFDPSDAESRAELLDPARSLPFLHHFALNEVRRVAQLSESCEQSKNLPSADRELEKARLFAAFFCGLTSELPADFFKAPPLMHPSGKSYVALALESGRTGFRQPEWLRDNRAFLHVSELKSWEDVAGALSPVERILAGLDREALTALHRGEGEVLSQDHVLFFVRQTGRLGVGGEYWAFERRDWRRFTNGLPFTLDARRRGTVCIEGDGVFCWLPAKATSAKWLAGLVAVASSALAILVAALVGVFAAWFREKRRDQERQLFVVRTLTHELRTPATSLGLTLEELRDDFDQLPARSQQAFLEMCAQVQLLHRVIAGSTRYLKTEEVRGAPSDEPGLPSLTAFFASILEPYEQRIVVEPLATDRGFRVDPYLLKVCVLNLIDNALNHGKPEVRVSLRLSGDALEVAVKDAGTLPHEDAAKLSAAAPYGKTQGLGLGLQIVAKIVKDLGGTLSLRRHPATFTLRLTESR